MANADSTATLNRTDSNYFTPTEPSENLSTLLNRAFGIADMLFTLSANNELNQFLPNTLTSSLDTLCYLIEQAKNNADKDC